MVSAGLPPRCRTVAAGPPRRAWRRIRHRRRGPGFRCDQPLVFQCAGIVPLSPGIPATPHFPAGPRFLASEESHLHPNYKQVILSSDGHDTLRRKIPDIAQARIWPGAMARIQRNRFIERWARREWALRQNQPEGSRQPAAARKAGDVDHGFLFIGQDAGWIDSLLPAAEVVGRMAAEAEAILAERLPAHVRQGPR